MTHEQAVQSLLTDWIAARYSIICERSGDIESDTRLLLAGAQARCALLGITYGLWLVPEHINDQIDMWDDWKAGKS